MEMSSLGIIWISSSGKKMKDRKGGREERREGKRNWGEKKKEKEKKKWPNLFPRFLVGLANAKCLLAFS